MFSSIAAEVSEMAYSIKPIDAARSFPQKKCFVCTGSNERTINAIRTVISQYTERASEIHLHNLVSSARYT